VASTSEVYGKTAGVPFNEDDDLWLGPTSKGRWSYACSKALDEYLALAYWKERGLPVVIGRLFNTVGSADHGLWRRQPAALLLPRQRRHPGLDWAHGDGAGARPSLQHRQHG
jgi:UDP-glucose 4-epimerase